MHKIFILLTLVFITSCTSSTQKKATLSDNDTVSTTFANEGDATRGYLVSVGDMAPDFEMELPDGSTVLLSSLRGKVVMLQFTASWCGVCRKEMPHIESDIWQRHKDHPEFALYGVDRDEPVDKIRR